MLFGRLRAFRHFCEQEAREEPPLQKRRLGQVNPAAAGGLKEGSEGLVAGGLPGGGAAGAADAAAPAAGQGPPQQCLVANAAGSPCPLAAAEGADARRALKQARGAAGEPDESVCTSPPDCLQPYLGHAVAFAGRSLWCLYCFEVPGSAHRSWRHGRCGGVRPPSAMPPALRDFFVRQPATCSGLRGSIRARWQELAGDQRLR